MCMEQIPLGHLPGANDSDEPGVPETCGFSIFFMLSKGLSICVTFFNVFKWSLPDIPAVFVLKCV